MTCSPSGSATRTARGPPAHRRTTCTRASCRALKNFNAGLLAGKALKYKVSVHGPIIGTATVGGRPYALARKRSTFGRDGLNLGALKDLTEGKASTPQRFWKAANQFGFTFNWAYASRKATSYFSSGRLPKRAPRARPAPAHPGHREVRVARLPVRGPAPARHRRPGRAAAQLEQPLGAGLHARRRRALRLRAAGRAVRQVPGQGAPARRGERDEPRGHRGRALARVAGDQQGASRRSGARTPSTSRWWTSWTPGSGTTPRGWTPTTTAPGTAPGRRSWTPPGRRSPRR